MTDGYDSDLWVRKLRSDMQIITVEEGTFGKDFSVPLIRRDAPGVVFAALKNMHDCVMLEDTLDATRQLKARGVSVNNLNDVSLPIVRSVSWDSFPKCCESKIMKNEDGIKRQCSTPD